MIEAGIATILNERDVNGGKRVKGIMEACQEFCV